MGNVQFDEIVAFWLGDSVKSPEHADEQKAIWYRGGPAVDARIEERFGETIRQARAEKLSHWESDANGALALVILLDQFTRNIFRGSVEAYSGDALAREIVHRAIGAGLDDALPITGRIFLYHPLHHSESLEEQNLGVALLEKLAARLDDEWQPYVEQSVKGFSGHRDIVARFGRFPHRNVTLGRPSTAQEQAFLDSGAENFGQGPAPTGGESTQE